MDCFSIEIAGLVARVYPLFESTREYCKPYLTNKEPELHVHVARDDLVFEQRMLAREAVEEGLKVRKFKDPFLERTSIQRRVADQLLNRNTLLLHGSTIAVDGNGYLFTAPCGTGKSTHTRLWREVFGDRAIMINDDKPFLQITSSGVLAYGSPWSGKHGLDTNICVPLKGICLLHRGKENTIHRIEPGRAIAALRHQAHTPTDISLQRKCHDLVDALSERVPLWEMYCNKEPDAAMVSYSAMSGNEVFFNHL